jgi:hypothetical protein
MDEKKFAVLNLLAKVVMSYFDMFRSGVSASGFRKLDGRLVITE